MGWRPGLRFQPETAGGCPLFKPPQGQLESLGGLRSPRTQGSLLPPHPVPSRCSSQEHPCRNFLRVKSLSYNVPPRKCRSQIGSRTFCTFSSVQSPPVKLGILTRDLGSDFAFPLPGSTSVSLSIYHCGSPPVSRSPVIPGALRPKSNVPNMTY